MKNPVFYTLIFFLVICNVSFSHEEESRYYKFIENKGQWPENVTYKAPINSGTMWLEKTCFTYDFKDYSEIMQFHIPYLAPKDADPNNIRFKRHVFKVNFVNSNPGVQVVNREPSSEYYNFYRGNDPSKWASGVKAFKKIHYVSLYQGIDMELYTQNEQLKYDFIIQPTYNHEIIELNYEGVDNISLKGGNLIVKTTVGEIIEQQPYCYQIINGQEKKVECKFKLNKNTVKFEVGNYDKSRPLVIDPVLIFASYSGSPANNFGMTATYDNAGNFYAGGIAFDDGYPTTTGAYDTSFSGPPAGGNTDVVITKYNSTGNAHIYSTYIGGVGTEAVHSLIVNDNNELYLYGTTSSNNFPTTSGAYDQSFNGGNAVYLQFNGTNFSSGTDIYIAKFNSNGTNLLASTYVGGSANDGLNYNTTDPQNYDSLQSNYGDQFRGEVMVDANDNCYIASSTRSSNFPIVNGFDNTFGGDQDGVVMKFNSTLTALQWSTFLGGSQKDAAYSLKLDASNNIYVTGGTISTDFPSTSGVINTTYQGGIVDGYVAKIQSNGSALLKSTFIGTGGYDQCYFVELDDDENVYVVGQSEGGFPIINAPYSNPGSGQFIAKMDNNLSNIIYSTVFGNGSGNADLSPAAFLVDRCQNVYVSGWGGNIITGPSMTGMPTTSDAEFATSPNGFDFYLIVFERDVQNILYGSYYGGTFSSEHVDGGTSRFDKMGVVYQSVCAGCQNNDDFPTTTGAWSNTNNSTGCNNGIFKLDFQIIPDAEFTTSDTAGCSPLTVVFVNQSIQNSTYMWNFGNGDTTSTEFNPIRTFTNPGTYIVTLVVTDTICNLNDTAQKIVTVYPDVQLASGDTIVCDADTIYLIANSFGTADTFIWSSNSAFSDTLNSDLTDSTLMVTAPIQATLYIKAINGFCEKTQVVNILLTNLNSFISDTDTSFCGACTGAAEVTPSGGTTPYSFQWNDANNQVTQTATALCVGNYSVTVTDALGCQAQENVTIIDTSDLALSLNNVTNLLCTGMCDGAASVSTSGGTLPFTFLWDDANSQTDAVATGLCAGTYQVSVTDSNQCIDILSINISEPAALLIDSVSSLDVLCYSECTGEAAVAVSGGTSPYTYAWGNSQTSSTITGLCDGSYAVTITDANGCDTAEFFQIIQPPQLQSIVASLPQSCFNVCDGQANVNTNGGTSPYNYVWSDSNAQTGDEATQLCPGMYSVTITDNNGCELTDSIEVIGDDFLPGALNLSVDEDTIFEGDITTLHAVPDSTGIYQWSPADYLNNSSSLNPLASPPSTITYTFTVTNPTNKVCGYDSIITIHVIELVCGTPNVFVPNAFTPNGDGNNDFVYVRGRNLKDVYFTIYNRWGEMVFETNDQNTGWDGMYNAREADPGVFVWYLTATCPGEEEFFDKGNVTLIR